MLAGPRLEVTLSTRAGPSRPTNMSWRQPTTEVFCTSDSAAVIMMRRYGAGMGAPGLNVVVTRLTRGGRLALKRFLH
ncbi:MAG: hypothetical protein AELANPGJ_03011 [Anaerolineae bacterium]|nr:hypothetical protein [Anaerolineae bacterium]